VPAKPAKALTGESYKSRIGDAALIDKSGKNWTQWFAILDKAGAARMQHAEITAILHKKHSAPPWWGQMIAVGYEQARGIRAKYESCNSTFSANCSRTFACNVKNIFRAWADDILRREWLAADKLVISKANPDKTIRGAWDGASRLEVRFYPKGADKTQLAIDHMNLADSATVEKMKAFWAKNLEKLRAIVETKTGAAPSRRGR
jgi:hypothetical protein